MIEGSVSEDGVPLIPMTLVGRQWMATVDTGFNGGLELPAAVKSKVGGICLGPVVSKLAGGVTISEEAFLVVVEFDGEPRRVQATFADVDSILVGTDLLSQHRLEIDFPSRSIRITKSAKDP